MMTRSKAQSRMIWLFGIGAFIMLAIIFASPLWELQLPEAAWIGVAAFACSTLGFIAVLCPRTRWVFGLLPPALTVIVLVAVAVRAGAFERLASERLPDTALLVRATGTFVVVGVWICFVLYFLAIPGIVAGSLVCGDRHEMDPARR